jgi:hypothetical protein
MIVEIMEAKDIQILYGLWTNSNDRTISKDIKKMVKQYYEIINNEKALPFYVLSKDYDQKTKNFKLFIGGIIENNGLDKVILEKGFYAKIKIKPKLGFIWGISIGEAKRYFYTKWINENKNIQINNMEYEFHTKESIGKNPFIEIYFSIKTE